MNTGNIGNTVTENKLNTGNTETQRTQGIQGTSVSQGTQET